MSSWGNYDASSNAPYWAAASVHKAPTSAEAALLYGNTTNSAYFAGEVDGLFAVDSNEAIVNNNHPGTGWVLRQTGTSSITSITANTGAYGANGYVTFTGGTGTAANAYMYVKTSGEVKNVAINYPGAYTVLPTSASVTGGAQNSAFTLVTSGRAGRVTEELLAVVATFKTDNNADDTIYPDSSVTITANTLGQKSFTAGAGNSNTFTVTATALPTGATLSYLWQVNTGSAWATAANGQTALTTYVGNTTNSLTVYATGTAANTYKYRVVVTATPPAGITNATATSVASANGTLVIY